MAINFDNVTGNQSSANVLAQINGNFAKINVEEPKWGMCKSVFVESISTLNNLAVGRYFCQQSKAPWEPLATQSSSNIRVFVLEVRQITMDEENIYSYNINYIYGEGAGSQYVSYYEYSETSGEYELQWKLNSGDVLTIATQNSLGGVKPVAKEYTMTQNVGIDVNGRLWTTPGGGGGSATDALILKGFLNNNSYALPTVDYVRGWAYIAEETIPAIDCNVFDMFIAKHDYSSIGEQIKQQLGTSYYSQSKILYETIVDKTSTSVNNLHLEYCYVNSDYGTMYNNALIYTDAENGNKGIIKLTTVEDNEIPKFTENTVYTKVIFNEGNVSDICVGYAPTMKIIGYRVATTEGSTTTYSVHATNLVLYDDGEEYNPDVKIEDLEDYNYTFENWTTIQCIEQVPIYYYEDEYNSVPIHIIINDNKLKLFTAYESENEELIPCSLTPIGDDYTWNNTSISNASINMRECGEQYISGTWYPTVTGIISYNDEANSGYCTFRMVKIAYNSEAETLEDFIVNVNVGSPHILAQNRTKNHNFALGYTSEEEDLILNIYNIYNNSSDIGYVTKMALSYNTDTIISSETSTVTFNAGTTTILDIQIGWGDSRPYGFYVAYANKSNRTAKFCAIDATTLEIDNNPTSETYDYYSPTYPIPSNVNLDNVIYRGSFSGEMSSLPSYTYLYKDSSTNHYIRYGLCCDDIWFLQSNLSNVAMKKGDGYYSILMNNNNGIAYGSRSIVMGESSISFPSSTISPWDDNEDIISDWEDRGSSKYSLAKGNNSHVEGSNCLALAKNTHAEGNGTIAGESAAHSEGTGSRAMGKYSHAGGLETIASGQYSFAHGKEVKASGMAATSFGYNNQYFSSGTNNASGDYSFTSGVNVIASGSASAAIGTTVNAAGNAQFVVGQHNESVSESANPANNAVFIVGNGTADNQKANAFTVYKDGHALINAKNYQIDTPLILNTKHNNCYIEFKSNNNNLGYYGFLNNGTPVVYKNGSGDLPIVTGVANSTTLGGVKPAAKTSDMTQSVGIDNNGALWTTVGAYTLPIASSDALGGIKANTKTSSMTQEIGIDSNGKLWTAPGSGATVIIFEEDDEQNITCNKTTYQISSAYNTPMFVYLKAYNDYDDIDIYYLTPSTYNQVHGETEGILNFINYKLNTDNNNISVTNINMYYDYDIEDDVITKTTKTISLT